MHLDVILSFCHRHSNGHRLFLAFVMTTFKFLAWTVPLILVKSLPLMTTKSSFSNPHLWYHCQKIQIPTMAAVAARNQKISIIGGSKRPGSKQNAMCRHWLGTTTPQGFLPLENFYNFGSMRSSKVNCIKKFREINFWKENSLNWFSGVSTEEVTFELGQPSSPSNEVSVREIHFFHEVRF